MVSGSWHYDEANLVNTQDSPTAFGQSGNCYLSWGSFFHDALGDLGDFSAFDRKHVGTCGVVTEV